MSNSNNTSLLTTKTKAKKSSKLVVIKKGTSRRKNQKGPAVIDFNKYDASKSGDIVRDLRILEKEQSKIKVEVYNFEYFYNELNDDRKRQLVSALAGVNLTISYADSEVVDSKFIESLHRLNQQSISTLSDGSLPEDAYHLPDNISFSKILRGNRVALKKKQDAEFNSDNKQVRNFVATLKILDVKEDDIASYIKEWNGKNLQEGARLKLTSGVEVKKVTVNRLFQQFKEMSRRVFDDSRAHLGGTDNSVLDKSVTRPDNKGLLKTNKLRWVNDSYFFTVFTDMKIELELLVEPKFPFYISFTEINDEREENSPAKATEILYIRPEVIVDKEIIIDLKKHTVLSVGRYEVQLFHEPTNIEGTLENKFTCTIGSEITEIEGIQMISNPVYQIAHRRGEKAEEYLYSINDINKIKGSNPMKQLFDLSVAIQ